MINPIPELKMINPMNQSKIRPKTPKAPPNLLLNSLLPLTTASLACSTFFFNVSMFAGCPYICNFSDVVFAFGTKINKIK